MTHDYLQMYLKVSTTSALKYMSFDLTHFLSAPGLAWQAWLKKTEVELELLTNVDLLLMVEKGIGGGICHAIHRYAAANNKYMKNYKLCIWMQIIYMDGPCLKNNL